MEEVKKGFLNPTWSQIGGKDKGPVDEFGLVAEPEQQDLLALYEDTVYSATKWLADTVGSVPRRLYVRKKNARSLLKIRKVTKSSHLDHVPDPDSLSEVLDHTLKDLLEQPNPEMNGSDLIRQIDTDLSLCGNSYLHKIRAEDDLPEELWSLSPDKIHLKINDSGQHIGFLQDQPTGYQKFIPKKDVIWFKLTDPSDRYGLGRSPARGVYERILLAKKEMAYLNALYKNQARPDSIMSVKGISPNEAEATQKQYNMRFREGGQGGIIVVDGEEIDIKPLNWNPKDILGTELYKWAKTQILQAWGLNDAIFSTENSNRSVAETALFQAMRNAVLPRLRLIEDKLNQHLIPEFDDRFLFVFDNPVQEDREMALKEETGLLAAGVIDAEEVRQRRGWPERAQEPVRDESGLRATVGGSQQIMLLQQAVYSGAMPREAALANAVAVFGFSRADAESLFPVVPGFTANPNASLPQASSE